MYCFQHFAAKTGSHFSIMPERRGLAEMTVLCQSLRARKIRVTQLHTVPQMSPKSPLCNWIHFSGFKACFFETYSHCNPRNRIHPPLSVSISFAFRLSQEKTRVLTFNGVTINSSEKAAPFTLNLNNNISASIFILVF